MGGKESLDREMEVFGGEDAAGRGNVGGEGSYGRKRRDGWAWPGHGNLWGERDSRKLATKIALYKNVQVMCM